MRWKDRISRFWIFRQGDNCALRRRRRLPEDKIQFALQHALQLGGSQEGGWVYTKHDSGVPNGNSGLGQFAGLLVFSGAFFAL
jgi:hypothetical protein